MIRGPGVEQPASKSRQIRARTAASLADGLDACGRVRAVRGLVLLLFTCMPQVAAAQDLAEAQRLFERGVELADADRWGESAEYFRRARAIVERPSIVCNLGIALHHLGEATDATEALLRCRALADADPRWGAANAALVERAGHFLDELSPAVVHLRVTVEPADVVLEIDGEVVPGDGRERVLELDPGRHVLTARTEGYVAHREEISLLSGTDEERALRLEPLPARAATLVVEAGSAAPITIDGVMLGEGRVEASFAAGAHEIRVDGPEPFERTVTLAEGERMVVDARGGGTPIEEEPAFWIAIAGGALLVVGGVVLAVVLSQPTDPFRDYQGTTGVVLTPLVQF